MWRLPALIILTFFTIFLSVAKVEWVQEVIHMGSLQESEGPREGMFLGINNDTVPVYINAVVASCGCTTTEYTGKGIEKGDTAVIKFKFDPQGRPGKFEKNLRVYITGEQAPKRLFFNGVVFASEETLAHRFPYGDSLLRMETDHVNMHELNRGARKHSFVSLYNVGTDSIKPEFKSPHKSLDLNLSPKIIAPGEASTLSIYFKSGDADHNGYNEYKIEGIVADHGINITPIKVSAIVLSSQ